MKLISQLWFRLLFAVCTALLASCAPGQPAIPATPDINVTPFSLDFGVTSEKELSLAIQNTGSADLIINNLSGLAAPFNLVAPPTLPFTISPGAQQVLMVRFTSATPDFSSQTLIINHNDADENASLVPLSGTGLGTPDINVTPLALNFGAVGYGQSVELSFAIQNTGTGALTITSLSGLAAPFSLVTPPMLPFAISAGAQQVLTVRFAPTQGGFFTRFSDSLVINSDDPEESPTSISLSGAGTRGLGFPH